MVRSSTSRVTWARAPICEREGDHLTTETEPTLRLSFRAYYSIKCALPGCEVEVPGEVIRSFTGTETAVLAVV